VKLRVCNVAGPCARAQLRRDGENLIRKKWQPERTYDVLLSMGELLSLRLASTCSVPIADRCWVWRRLRSGEKCRHKAPRDTEGKLSPNDHPLVHPRRCAPAQAGQPSAPLNLMQSVALNIDAAGKPSSESSYEAD
jgi:hypothetical protein